MLALTMREMTDAERVISNACFDMRERSDSAFWTHLWGRVHQLRDEAVESVLHGLEPDEYRRKLGFIAALDEVILIPRELDELNEQVKESLNG